MNTAVVDLLRTFSKSASAWVAAAMLVTTTAAQAAPPADCASGTELWMYKAGVTQGVSLVNQAWKATDVQADCANFDKFKQALTDAFASVMQQPIDSIKVACRRSGLYDGAVAHVNELDQQCAACCGFDGELTGWLGALAYCALVPCAPFLLRDPGICPPAECRDGFADVCMSTFADVTLSWCHADTQGWFQNLWYWYMDALCTC
jgi:hypothetical protein